MAYTDLGKYQFTTSADYTGLNSGNLTSVLALTSLRIPYFEMYRLLINTSSIPPIAGLPAVVQTSPVAVGGSLTTLAITFAKATTLGNTIAVGVASGSTATDPAVTAMTLGGAADHFGSILSAGNASTNTAAMWLDPTCATSSAAIAVTLGGGTGTAWTSGIAYELSGLLSTTTPSAAVDVSGTLTYSSGAGTTSPQTTNVSTTTANDMQIGFAAPIGGSGYTIAGPGTWTSTGGAISDPLGAGQGYFGAMGSWNLAAAAGSSGIYAPTSSAGVYWANLAASLLPSTTAPVQVPFPFTVAIDGVTWDKQMTVAGVGYTYTIGQSPLYLTNGQTLQVLWQLPAAQYGAYAPQFNLTGWFRYDPSVQPG